MILKGFNELLPNIVQNYLSSFSSAVEIA